jgi:hypothetical protein
MSDKYWGINNFLNFKSIWDLKVESIPNICDFCKNLLIDELQYVAICTCPEHLKSISGSIICTGHKLNFKLRKSEDIKFIKAR